MKKNVLAVIPARGGSKGIPKKNIRLLNGKPLIFYVITTALSCEEIDDVYVSTDDGEIAEVARNYGAEVIIRNGELAEDHVTLDPVIYNALSVIEKQKRVSYDYVITLQPTSPLLTLGTLSSAIKTIIASDYDCMISVVNKPCLSWARDENGGVMPNYIRRLNRQQLPPDYKETGAFIISKRQIVNETSRISGKVSIFEIPEAESVDIDDTNDWIVAENALKRKKIVFRVDGYDLLGMGHIYNCITLAYSLIEHDVLFVISSRSIEGIRKIKQTFFPYEVINDDSEIDRVVSGFRPDIWVNDCLDTAEDYIRHLKSMIPKVISIEDLGDGTRYADAVINALYTEDDLKGDNIFSGWRYVCLRDEFQLEIPIEFHDEVKTVLIMFGGTDPSNMTKMVYDIILSLADNYPDVRFVFITGIGYDCERNGIVTNEEKRTYIYPDVERVTKYMKEADLAIISQGRTIFEIAAMGIPSIVLSQNEREASHRFATMRHGFINLGVGSQIDPKLIGNTLHWLITTKVVRKSMHEMMIKYPLREGLERVKQIILES